MIGMKAKKAIILIIPWGMCVMGITPIKFSVTTPDCHPDNILSCHVTTSMLSQYTGSFIKCLTDDTVAAQLLLELQESKINQIWAANCMRHVPCCTVKSSLWSLAASRLHIEYVQYAQMDMTRCGARGWNQWINVWRYEVPVHACNVLFMCFPTHTFLSCPRQWESRHHPHTYHRRRLHQMWSQCENIPCELLELHLQSLGLSCQVWNAWFKRIPQKQALFNSRHPYRDISTASIEPWDRAHTD